MTRDLLAPTPYWDHWIDHSHNRIEHMWAKCKEPPSNPRYRPQYVFEIAREYWQLMLERYSRGDPVRELVRYFPGLLDAWEESERLGADVFTPEQQFSRHSWATNLDNYIVCFWLTGLALALDIPDDQWRRLVVLMGNEGEDALLDRVIASRDPGRRIGTVVCHPIPYARLLEAIDASPPEKPRLLRTFVENWYAELNRAPKRGGVAAIYDRPYWYGFSQNIEGGAYFGFWCVEAVAAVKAFGLDDSLCLGQPHYPGDLLRPDGPTTHVSDSSAQGAVAAVAGQSRTALQSLLKRLLGKK